MVHTAASSIFENGSTHDHQKAKVSSTLLTSFQKVKPVYTGVCAFR